MRVRDLIYLSIAAVLSACSGLDAYDEPMEQMERMPVLFSAGNTEAMVTRASGQASYMPLDSRFVVRAGC